MSLKLRSNTSYWPVSCFAYNLMWQAHQLVHIVDDSASAKRVERVDREKLRGEKVEGVSVLPRELFGTYNIYLLPPPDESLNPNRDHSLSCTKLDNKEQGFGVHSKTY